MEIDDSNVINTMNLIRSSNAEVFCGGTRWEKMGTKIPDGLIYLIRNNCIRPINKKMIEKEVIQESKLRG